MSDNKSNLKTSPWALGSCDTRYSLLCPKGSIEKINSSLIDDENNP